MQACRAAGIQPKLTATAFIQFIVMFRARFSDVLPKGLATFGPQELERDIVDTTPGERVEHFLCALLGLVLNRKQDVKYAAHCLERLDGCQVLTTWDCRPGHYNRALEEAIQTHKSQWPRDWNAQSPLAGGATFASMTPVQRVRAHAISMVGSLADLMVARQLVLLRTLVHWALSSSEAVKTTINQQYKNRTEDDLNIGLSVQPWGSDGDKRRYFLIEGNDDTTFRVYRESNPAGLQRTWWSIAGSIDELKVLADKLENADGGPKAKALSRRILNSIPRFEATEEKRRRREYRHQRKEQFKRPDNGLSLYEGRTRGKRMKYTYSDDEGDFYSDSTNRRSARDARNPTPAKLSGPVVTASGRQIRAPTRLNANSDAASNGETSAAPSVCGDAEGDVEMDGASFGPTGRPRRSAAVHHSMNGWASKRKGSAYDTDEEEEASEQDLGDEEEEHVPDDSDEDEDEFDQPDFDDEDLTDSAKDNHLFRFPLKAAIDIDGKAKLFPNAVPSTDKRKHLRAAPSHHNAMMSDESTSRSKSSGVTKEHRRSPTVEEKAAEEVISVVIKRPSPGPRPPILAETTNQRSMAAQPLPTPPNSKAASLAFRGSPEKPPPEALPRPIDVGGSE